ncbi:hypothetical protein FKP32DRAFT_1678679 [Trametes sanguinea]|nr:hypothetical protein FKP32DRAFT_1678679 [Trametes sanguinea]
MRNTSQNRTPKPTARRPVPPSGVITRAQALSARTPSTTFAPRSPPRSYATVVSTSPPPQRQTAAEGQAIAAQPAAAHADRGMTDEPRAALDGTVAPSNELVGPAMPVVAPTPQSPPQSLQEERTDGEALDEEHEAGSDCESVLSYASETPATRHALRRPDDLVIYGSRYDAAEHIEEAILESVSEGGVTFDDFITDGIGRDGRPLPGQTPDWSQRTKKRRPSRTPSPECDRHVVYYDRALERSGSLPMPHSPPPAASVSHEPAPTWLPSYAHAPLHPPPRLISAREELQRQRDAFDRSTAALAEAIARGSVSPPPTEAQPTATLPIGNNVDAMRGQSSIDMDVDPAAASAAGTTSMVGRPIRPLPTRRSARPLLNTSSDAPPVTPQLTPTNLSLPPDAVLDLLPGPALQHAAEVRPAGNLRGATRRHDLRQGSNPPDMYQQRRPPTPFPVRGSTPYDRPGGMRGLALSQRGPSPERPLYRPADLAPPPANAPAVRQRTTYTAQMATLRAYAPQGFSFTAPPEAGFEPHDFPDPEYLLRGMAPDRMQALWAEEDAGTVLLELYGPRTATPGRIRQLTDSITAAIASITGETDFRVVPPELEWHDQVEEVDDSAIFAAVRLTPAGARTLTSQRVWSSPTVTFFAYPRLTPIPTFLCTLGGFAHDRDGDIIHTVWATFNGPRILPAILQLVQTNPAYMDRAPDEAANAVLSSLTVQVSYLDNGNIIAAVYCESPTNSLTRWREWRDLIASTPFRSLFNSTARARRPRLCDGCHSASHPTHLCPLPDLPGWNAPPLRTPATWPGANALTAPPSADDTAAPAGPSHPIGRGRGTGYPRGNGRGMNRRDDVARRGRGGRGGFGRGPFA